MHDKNAFLNLFLFICVVWNQVAVLSTIKAVPSNRNCHSLLKARLFYMFLIVWRQMCEIVLILQTFLLNPLSAAPRTLLNLWVNSHSPMGKPSLSLCFHSLVFQRPMILLYLPQLKMCFLIPKRKKGSIAESPFQRERLQQGLPLLFRSEVKWTQYPARVHFEEPRSLLDFLTKHR